MFAFPRPTGPHAIGTVTYHWVDADRREVFSADPDDRRELIVQVWYPARDLPSSPRAAYMPDADVVAPALARFLGVPESTFGLLKDVRTNAVASAPVADDDQLYPVLIMRLGLKGSYRQVQTFQVEELVSHGYVVAAIDQPYAAAMVVFPDGRQAAYDEHWDPPHSAFMDAHIPYIAADAIFTLDELAAVDRSDPHGVLTGRLDLERAGTFATPPRRGVSHVAGALCSALCLLDVRENASPVTIILGGAVVDPATGAVIARLQPGPVPGMCSPAIASARQNDWAWRP